MRTIAIASVIVLSACKFDSAPHPHGTDASPDGRVGAITLTAVPAVFLMHENDARDTTLTMVNATNQTISVSSFQVSGLSVGMMTFSTTTCTATLASGESCSATGHLTATSTGQAVFQIAMGAASTSLAVTALLPCPVNCGPSGATNCCKSSIIPGNAAGATLAGQQFYRSYDVAPDNLFPSTDDPATVSDFRLDAYEVTVARFRAFVAAGMGTSNTAPPVGAGAHAKIPDTGWDVSWNASLTTSTAALMAALNCDSTYQTWTNDEGANESLPMNCMSWYEAMAFCIWDGGYLPTEAEWNYAASGGGEQRAYSWSSPAMSTSIDCSYANYLFDLSSIAYCINGEKGGVNRVGSESPKGDGKWGQSDMEGNLWEWNLDWFSANYQTPCNDCANMAIAFNHVARGGSFFQAAVSQRVALRFSTSARSSAVGVRCARAS